MRHVIPAALMSFLIVGGCSKQASKGSSNEKCKSARSEAAAKWEETHLAWGRIHASWSDKALLSKVEKALTEKIGAGEEGPAKVSKEMVTLKDYVTFKIQLGARVARLAKAAAEALKNDPDKALKAASRARRASADPSVTRNNKAAWFTTPAVADIDEAQDKALALATEARDLTDKAEQACKK